MNIVTHRDIPEDTILREAWNLLVEKMQPSEIFYTYEWALAVTRAYRDSRPPLLFLGYVNDILVGVAALAICENQRVEFLNANTADYCDFVGTCEDREEFAARVLEELRSLGMRSIALANLSSESPTARMLAESRHCGFYTFSQKAYNCGQVELATPLQRESVRQSIAKKKGVKRDTAALAKLGELKMQHRRRDDDVLPVLPEFYRAHVARFLERGSISNIARSERRAFLSELAYLLSDAGWMTLSSLTVGERKIAWNYGFEFGGNWFWYQPTFDTALGKYFPGFCLLTMLVQDAADRETVQRIDLGLGDESYKTRLATAHRETLHITLSRSYISHLKTGLRAIIASKVKKAPRLERALRKIMMPERSRQIRKSEVGDLPAWRTPTVDDCCSAAIAPLTLDLLARVVMNHVDDAKTVEYALRAASRLKSSALRGFAALNGEGMPVRIFWDANCGEAVQPNILSSREAKI
jgi:CelD/BcsL family acetyltransferase involved in cellulose biosynthesis